MNRITLVGRLASDPEARVTSKGNPQSRLSIAVSDLRNWNDTYFFNCIAWQQNATYINNNLKKGDFIAIDGRLTNRNYVNNEGRKIYITEIIVDNIKNYGSSGNKKNTIDKSSNNMVELNNSISESVNINLEDAFGSANNTTKTNNKELKKSSTIDWEDDLDD